METQEKEISTYKSYRAEWDQPTEEQIKDDPLAVDFYKDSEFLYSLKKNDYRTEDDDFVLLEWFDHPHDPSKTVFIFNLDHSVISVIDADTGKEIHQDKLFDVFISGYRMFDNREYMYISGWFWSPLPVRCIYHIPTFLKTPDYEPVYISCYDQVGTHPEISLYGCDTVTEFLDKKDQIFDDMKIKDETDMFNRNREQEILLRLFLTSPEVTWEENSKQVLSDLLSKDQERLYIRTWGNVSGDPLNRYNRSLYSLILYEEDNPKAIDRNKTSRTDTLGFLIPKILFSGFITKLPLEFIDLRFEIYTNDTKSLTINLRQELTWDGKDPLPHDYGKRRCNVDLAKKAEIRIS